MPRVQFKPMSDYEIHLRRTRHYKRKNGLVVTRLNEKIRGLVKGRRIS